MAAQPLVWTPDAVLDDDLKNELLEIARQAFFEKFMPFLNHYEDALQRSPPTRSHYLIYGYYLTEIASRIASSPHYNRSKTKKLVFKLNSRTLCVLKHALFFFKNDEYVWTLFLYFITIFKYTKLLYVLLDGALLFNGRTFNSLYYSWMLRLCDPKFNKTVDFHILTEIRHMFSLSAVDHKNSEFLIIELFKLELGVAFRCLREGMPIDSIDLKKTNYNLNKLIQQALENVQRHSSIFYQMYELSTWYKCASRLSKQILRFMISTSTKDPNYWDAAAKNELTNDAHHRNLRMRNCIEKYKEGVLVLNTNEMWNKYIEFVFEQSLSLNMEPEHPESDSFLITKRILVKHCMWNIHKKKKFKPSHYIRWINQFNSSMAIKMIECALERYSDNIKVLNAVLRKLMKIDKPSAYKLFKMNAKKFSNTMWLHMVNSLSNEPFLQDILSMVFKDDSIYSDEVRSSLASQYLHWVDLNKSLDAARHTYFELIKNNNCNKKLYRAMINIELHQPQICIINIRTHFIMACSILGYYDTDLWTMRANFELKYGTKRTKFFVWYWASKILKKENVEFSNILS